MVYSPTFGYCGTRGERKKTFETTTWSFALYNLIMVNIWCYKSRVLPPQKKNTDIFRLKNNTSLYGMFTYMKTRKINQILRYTSTIPGWYG